MWWRVRRWWARWCDHLDWWWCIRRERPRLRRALSSVQAALECVDRLDDVPIGAVRPYPLEESIRDARRELVAAETRLRELVDFEEER